MIEVSSRFIAFGGSRVRVDHAGPRSREIVEFLFRDTRDREAGSLQATFRVEDAADSDSVTVHRDADVCYRGESLGDAARALQDATSFSLAAGTTGGLLFHAASVSRQGRAVLLSGASGSGKTTLTTWLLTGGFEYLTDELSFVADGSLSVEALSRPLNVKSSGRVALPPGVDSLTDWTSLSGSLTTLVRPPASSLGARRDPTERPTLAALVFPRYQRAASFSLERLTSAGAGLRLMSCLLNARNLGDHGFPAVTALARKVPSFDLIYGDVAEVSPYLRDLVRGTPLR